MDSKCAYEWLEREQFNQWRLNRGENEKVAEYVESDESIEDSLLRFQDIIKLQQPGSYMLNGYRGKGRQAAKAIFRFDIPSVNTVSTTTKMNSPAFDYNELLQKAKDLALNQFREEQFKEDIKLRLTAIESDIKDLKKVIADLTDDNEDNDDNALAKLSTVGEKLPGLISGLSNLKGMILK